MRLIDADKLADALFEQRKNYPQWVADTIGNMPDAVVRCKDCKHATMTADGKMCKYCEMDTDDFGDQRDVYHDANWFCADGERRCDDG
jgi:recombinational DNA repair protein RecR